MPSQPQRIHRFTGIRCIIPLAALLAVVPMLIRGPSCGHDFDFHLLSWLEASTQFAHFGFPYWAYTPAFNAGEPRFIFYPPISWSVGAILGLILPWNLVPIAFTWIALTLSGLTFHRLASRYTNSSAAILTSVLYLANPYMLFTAYERTAFAELLAAAWLPLLFQAALARRIRILPVALPLALIWLTNAPAAIMSTYTLAFLTIVRLLIPHDLSHPEQSEETLFIATSRNAFIQLRLAVTIAAGTALGLALAAFYILPAAYERRYVQIQMLVIDGMRVSDHFLFHRMPGQTPDDRFHDAVVRTASLVAISLLAAIMLTFFFAYRTSQKSRHSERSEEPLSLVWTDESSLIVSLTLLTLAIAFLLTPISLLLWTHLPQLAFLQFPWRLTALLGLIFAIFTAIALRRFHQFRHPPTAILSLLLATLLIAPAWHFFRQRCFAEDAVPARVALFHSNFGTEPTDEYTPIHADPDALHPYDPPYWLIPANPAPPDLNAPAPLDALPGQAPTHLTLTLLVPEYLVLNRRQYPAWQLRLNHAIVEPATPERDDGLIALLLPPGTDTIDLTLVRTPDQTIGLLISTIAFLLAMSVGLRQPKTPTTGRMKILQGR